MTWEVVIWGAIALVCFGALVIWDGWIDDLIEWNSTRRTRRFNRRDE